MPLHTLPKLILSICLFAFGASAHALTLSTFDTLGPTNAYLPDYGWSVGGGSVIGPTGANYVPAHRFLAESSGLLESAEAVMWRAQGSPPVTFNLRADNNGAPGAVIASGSAEVPDTAQLVVSHYDQNPMIVAGSFYWFSLATEDLSAAFIWNMNAYDIRGLIAFTGAIWQAPDEWFYQTERLGAFRVSVSSPVPEPSTAILLLAVALIPALSKSRRRAG